MNAIIDVLIVDDDADWQSRLGELVQDKFSTHAVSSESEAMKIIQRQYFHCAIVDKSLVAGDGNDEGGMRVLEELKNIDVGTKRLMLTSYGSIDSAVRALADWDASIYFEKNHLQGIGSQEVKNKIEQMVMEARQDYDKRFASGIDQLVAKFNPRERAGWETSALMALSAPRKQVDYGLFCSLLDLLLKDLPVLLPYGADTPLSINKETATMEGNFWSMGLGTAVTILIGRKESIAAKLQDHATHKVIRQVSKGGLDGTLLQSNLKFEDLPSSSMQ